MSSITYDRVGSAPYWGTPVRLDGKLVGEIRSYRDGFGYVPKGKRKPGAILPTIEAVKRSLEEV